MKYVDVAPVFKALTNLTPFQLEYLQMKIGNEGMQKLGLRLCADNPKIFEKLMAA